MMEKLKWCKEQKKGIELVEPNVNLSEGYMKEARQTLLRVQENKDKWDIIMGYYACYNALYSLLMKAGIKCEIHDCTIELINFIPGFKPDDYTFLLELKQLRTQVQYYLQDQVLQDSTPLKKFVLKCIEIKENLNIPELRRKISGKK